MTKNPEADLWRRLRRQSFASPKQNAGVDRNGRRSNPGPNDPGFPASEALISPHSPDDALISATLTPIQI